MADLKITQSPELAWGTRLSRYNTWSLQTATRTVKVEIPCDFLQNATPNGTLLVVETNGKQVKSKPVIIRGKHEEYTVLKHFAWVPTGLEHIQCVLWRMLNAIKIQELWDFYYSVLTDDELMEPFYRAKASHHHHHSYDGGLLVHSFEVATSAADLCRRYNLGHATICIAFIAGLLHDIGKLKMYYNEKQHAGVCGQHEAFNFMVLAAPLERLHRAAPNMFEALSSALVAKTGQHPPQYLPETIVRLCDKISAEIAQCRDAFAGMPEYYWYAKSGVDKRIFKRPG